MQKLKRLWCRLLHRGAMWPMHSKYTCPKCQLEHPVRWEVA